jgi:hypothetical protein
MGDEQAGQGREKAEKQAGNLPQAVKGPSIISYNLREEERPGGLKVRFKVKAETGRKARETGARQAAAIRELLIWARQRQNPMP